MYPNISNKIILKYKKKNNKLVTIEDANRLKDSIKSRKAPLGVGVREIGDSKSEFKDYKDWLATTSGFLEGLTNTDEGSGLKPTILYDYQKKFLNDSSRLRFVKKSRQTGFSYIFAGEGMTKSMLKHRHTGIFTSFNEDEAKEKIRYALSLYESMPMKWRKARKLVVNNKTSLEWTPMKGSMTTRLLSHPQRDVRGKGGGIDIYLDELAQYTYSKRIYLSAMPVISRGGGVLTCASTTFGKQGRFYDIDVNEDNKYSGFSRHEIFWWDCPVYCKNVKRARREAFDMTTEQRVYEFGTFDLIFEYENMGLEEFQQEFECIYIDDNINFYPIALIMSCVPTDPEKGTLKYPYAGEDLNLLLMLLKNGSIKGRLLAGYDIGRKKNTSELIISDEDLGTKMQRVVYQRTYDNIKLRNQENELRKHLNSLPIKRMGIDSTGLGKQIGETLEDEYPSRVEAIDFTNEWKEDAANQLLIRLQDKLILLPQDKKLINHIHSIKRILTPAGHFRYDTEKNEKHHADKYFSLVLCSMMGEELKKHSISKEIIEMVKGTKTDNELKRKFTGGNKRKIYGKDLIKPATFNPNTNTSKIALSDPDFIRTFRL